MNINAISTSVNVAICTSMVDIHAATPQATIIHNTWLATPKDEVEKSMQNYWSIRHMLAIINNISMKGKRITILSLLQGQILKQLQSNHTGIEKNETFSQGVSVFGKYKCTH